MQAMSYHRLPRNAFEPNPLVRSAEAQMVLAMVRPRHVTITSDERPVLIDAGYDHTSVDTQHPVRLLGYFNRSRRPEPSRGLVLLLHGWEGCSHSTYNLVMAEALVKAGYDTFRLNMRDHGPGIHVNPYVLNRGLFLGTLIEEVAAATRQVAQMAGHKDFFIVGPSMGGSFALRLAIWHSQRQPFANLRKVVAVCPAVNPGRATDALDSHPATRHYFRRHWLRSLRAKQALHPDLFNFDGLAQIARVREMTDWVIEHYGHMGNGAFHSADDYFDAYAVRSDALAHLTVPATIITAINDPVIPVVDIYALAPHPLLDVQIHPTGAHCSFIDAPPLRHRLPALVLDELMR